MRALPKDVDRQKARAALGLRERDFLVCSFGFLWNNKLNDELLNAWLTSRLKDKRNCHLVFVGEAISSEYCDRLRAVIKQSSANIRITGYAPPSLYQQYLAAADLAVQLRCNSRGESSGTVLDCMAHGVPVIVNAHGSLAELPDDGVIKLAENFTQADLVTALETGEAARGTQHKTLGQRARSIIENNFAPAAIADQYRLAIEQFAKSAPTLFDIRALSRTAAKLARSGENESVWLEKARALAREAPLKRPARQLLVDVSAMVRDDLRTGIQRVVKAQLF